MHSSTQAAPDPEAQRPLALSGRSCHPLPWALSAALLLLAAACAACLVRAWAAPGAPASQVPGSARSPRLPEGLELTPDARTRLPDSPQAEGGGTPIVPLGPPRAPLLYPGLRGAPFSSRTPGVFAQLVVADVQLTEGPLHWCSEQGMTGVTLAPGVSYDKHTHEVVVVQAGVYYVFLHLALKRAMASNGNSSGSVSVALNLRPLQAGAAALALTLDLPPPSSGNSAAGFRSGLLHLDAGQRLSVHLRLAVREPRAWQLSADATVLGLFHVATQVPTGLSLIQLT
ncbi:PREDICTED: tumor necrosis factor ligand superfamily member 9 [Lipotes vexillifer]|uniref:Tumor necrosis factor ligand superfamily member 9 n=1 Tax=Lipotes vexillifer TaxID=118797 RepID=A0A340XP44_LIPVE|nr:PREDICTED: tumor necrosis factor ligand superfamily member 9 [Lipotes vexillifer]